MRPCCVGGTTPWCTATCWPAASSTGKSSGTEDPAPTNDNQPPPHNLAAPRSMREAWGGRAPRSGATFRCHVPATPSGGKFRRHLPAAPSGAALRQHDPAARSGGSSNPGHHRHPGGKPRGADRRFMTSAMAVGQHVHGGRPVGSREYQRPRITQRAVLVPVSGLPPGIPAGAGQQPIQRRIVVRRYSRAEQSLALLGFVADLLDERQCVGDGGRGDRTPDRWPGPGPSRAAPVRW